MRLLLLYGPPAVGKLTIAKEIALRIRSLTMRQRVTLLLTCYQGVMSPPPIFS